MSQHSRPQTPFGNCSGSMGITRLQAWSRWRSWAQAQRGRRRAGIIVECHARRYRLRQAIRAWRAARGARWCAIRGGLRSLREQVGRERSARCARSWYRECTLRRAWRTWTQAAEHVARARNHRLIRAWRAWAMFIAKRKARRGLTSMVSVRRHFLSLVLRRWRQRTRAASSLRAYIARWRLHAWAPLHRATQFDGTRLKRFCLNHFRRGLAVVRVDRLSRFWRKWRASLALVVLQTKLSERFAERHDAHRRLHRAVRWWRHWTRRTVQCAAMQRIAILRRAVSQLKASARHFAITRHLFGVRSRSLQRLVIVAWRRECMCSAVVRSRQIRRIRSIWDALRSIVVSKRRMAQRCIQHWRHWARRRSQQDAHARKQHYLSCIRFIWTTWFERFQCRYQVPKIYIKMAAFKAWRVTFELRRLLQRRVVVSFRRNVEIRQEHRQRAETMLSSFLCRRTFYGWQEAHALRRALRCHAWRQWAAFSQSQKRDRLLRSLIEQSRQRRFIRVWHNALHDRRLEWRSLYHWSLAVQRRSLETWASYARMRRAKAGAYAAVEDARRLQLIKGGVRAWFDAFQRHRDVHPARAESPGSQPLHESSAKQDDRYMPGSDDEIERLESLIDAETRYREGLSDPGYRPLDKVILRLINQRIFEIMSRSERC
ncbi:Sfi1 spindle body domain-containing protein [Plasmodiophora brassicae]